MIVLTAEQAGKLLWKDQFSHALLRPLRLSDNRYALPESVLTQPEHARWRSLLQSGSIEAVGTLTVDSMAPADYRIVVDGTHEMFLYTGTAVPQTFGFPAPSLFDIPTTNLYRFESRHIWDVASPDRVNQRKRVEFLQNSGPFFVSGDTIWDSWSTVITDQRAGFDAARASYIHQWHQHPDSAFPTPPSGVVLDSGTMFIYTRSSADGGVNHVHYTVDAPEDWAVTHFVVQGTLGASGHLNVWINGAQVVNVDTPIGYYSEALAYLVRVQSGIYMDNTHTVDAIYHANIEFGTASLLARVDNPLPLPAPPEGWPGTVAAPYPDATLYPASNLYPA